MPPETRPHPQWHLGGSRPPGGPVMSNPDPPAHEIRGEGLRGGGVRRRACPPRPCTFMLALRTSVAGGCMGVSVTGRSGVGRGSGGNATSRRAGGCHACEMPVNGRDKAIVGSMGRRCVSTSSSLNRTYVTGYTSSIGRAIFFVRPDILRVADGPRQAEGKCRSETACRHCLLHVDPKQIPQPSR